MSGRYWDVRTCSWQGEVEVAPPVWPAAPTPAPLPEAVPAQATAAEAERLPSAQVPA